MFEIRIYVADELELKYKNAKANVEELKLRGCTVKHEVNVHTMRNCRGSEIYDRIILNFPHSWFGFGCEYHRQYIM